HAAALALRAGAAGQCTRQAAGGGDPGAVRMNDRQDQLPAILGVEANPDRVVIDLGIDARLFWFRGHFPGFPVLPGVGLVDWALGFGRRYFATPPRSRELSGIKFRRPLRPGDELRLVLQRERGGSRLAFVYQSGSMPVASGRFDFAAPPR